MVDAYVRDVCPHAIVACTACAKDTVSVAGDIVVADGDVGKRPRVVRVCDSLLPVVAYLRPRDQQSHVPIQLRIGIQRIPLEANRGEGIIQAVTAFGGLDKVGNDYAVRRIDAVVKDVDMLHRVVGAVLTAFACADVADGKLPSVAKRKIVVVHGHIPHCIVGGRVRAFGNGILVIAHIRNGGIGDVDGGIHVLVAACDAGGVVAHFHILDQVVAVAKVRRADTQKSLIDGRRVLGHGDGVPRNEHIF